MKKDYKKGWLIVGLCISTVAFSSCSDWTEPESLELTYTPTVSEQNPQLYDDLENIIICLSLLIIRQKNRQSRRNV